MNVKGREEKLTKKEWQIAAYWIEEISCRVNREIIKFTEDTKLGGVALTSKDWEIILLDLWRLKAGQEIKLNSTGGKIEAAMPMKSNLKHKYSVSKRSPKGQYSERGRGEQKHKELAPST